MARRPRDPNQLAKLIVDISIGEAEDTVSKSKRHPSNRRIGGLKGGKARAKKLTAEERRKIARNAARARWKTDAYTERQRIQEFAGHGKREMAGA